MEAFVALDVAIGLVFVYLLLAIFCTAINEWIAGLFRLRARNLRTAVSRLVDADGPPSTSWLLSMLPGQAEKDRKDRLSARILEHPLIVSLKDGKRGPSYVPAPRFVAALRDTVANQERPRTEARPEGKTKNTAAVPGLAADLTHVEKQVKALERTAPPRVRMAVAAAKDIPADAGHDEADRIEEWFNQAMERATGWYKRKLMFITIVVAAVITILSNADTIAAARILWRNPTVRAAVVAQAQERVKRPRPADGGLLVVQADYPNKDKPISDESTELDEDNPENENTATDEPDVAADGSGLTDGEREALAQLIGWERDFKVLNTEVCATRQKAINDACKVGAETSPDCTRAVDNATVGGLCTKTGSGLEPTGVFPGRAAILPLAGTHLLGWFLTAIAVSMGAPFWFDTLKLFMSIRSTGKSPDEKK